MSVDCKEVKLLTELWWINQRITKAYVNEKKQLILTDTAATN
jgi:hypothetical protein